MPVQLSTDVSRIAALRGSLPQAFLMHSQPNTRALVSLCILRSQDSGTRIFLLSNRSDEYGINFADAGPHTVSVGPFGPTMCIIHSVAMPCSSIERVGSLSRVVIASVAVDTCKRCFTESAHCECTV